MKQISLGEIMWSVTKNPLVAGITYEDAAESAMNLLRILKIPLAMVTENKVLEIIEYKAKLPDSLINVNAVRDLRSGVRLIYGANPFHTSALNPKHIGCENENSYILQNCNIITSFEDGEIEVSFDRLETDTDGFPMIPDNESMINAVKYHIMFEYLEGLWMVGKITDKAFQHVQQQRDWYIGQASSSMKLVNMDQAVTMMNSVNRLLIDTKLHEKFYRNMGTSETIKRHW